MQTLTPGVLLNNGTFRIEWVLGQGGFGITYLAIDTSLDRKVAIKEFFPKAYCDRDETTSHVTLRTKNTAEFVNRLKAKFLKEARNIAKFDHPGIIKIHAAFEENNTAYYVMDYIEGESLSAMVKRNGPLPEAKALKYIEKVGRALEYVHTHRMNHLDVKPANIMVRKKNDEPILIDFGLSKQYDSKGDQTSTTPVGLSHGYAPIEQYSNEGVSGFSPQTDLYSLAATFYYLLSGLVPASAPDLIHNELSFPQTIRSIYIKPISKAMATMRKERHSSIKEFLGDIQNSFTLNDATDFSAPIEEANLATCKSINNRVQTKSSFCIRYSKELSYVWILLIFLSFDISAVSVFLAFKSDPVWWIGVVASIIFCGVFKVCCKPKIIDWEQYPYILRVILYVLLIPVSFAFFVLSLYIIELLRN